MKNQTVKAAAAAAVVLGLAGCVVPPPGGYATTGPYYAQPQANYAPPPQDYPGEQYVYTDGTPYAVVGGQQYVVLFDAGLGWGYYDGYHHWHGAPGRWRDDFDRRYPGGRGYTPGGPRESNFRPGFPPAFARPEGQPPGRPGGPPQGFARPEGPPPGRQGFARPEGPPPGRPGGQPAAFARPAGPPAAAPAHAAPPAAPAGPHYSVRPGCGTPGSPHC